jgi:hypothetical protein
MNMFILIVNALAESSGIDNPTSHFHGKWFPTITLGLAGLAIFYYWTFFAAYTPEPFWGWSFFKWANTECRIEKNENFDDNNEESRRFGLRRSIYPMVSDLGCYDIFPLQIILTTRQLRNSHPIWQASIFWLFGGRIDPSPVERMEETWEECKRVIGNNIRSFKKLFLTEAPTANGMVHATSGEEIEMNGREVSP